MEPKAGVPYPLLMSLKALLSVDYVATVLLEIKTKDIFLNIPKNVDKLFCFFSE